MGKHNEYWFEDELATHLAANGWEYSTNDTGYDEAKIESAFRECGVNEVKKVLEY